MVALAGAPFNEYLYCIWIFTGRADIHRDSTLGGQRGVKSKRRNELGYFSAEFSRALPTSLSSRFVDSF